MSRQPDDAEPSQETERGGKRYADEKARDERTGRSAAAERVRDQTRWVDLQVQRAMERGEFDDLPGAGKPLDLPDKHDPDWWVKKLIEREQITGITPAAISLRREDAEMDALLDREATEDGVRRVIEDFNVRVIDARRQLTGGPPVVTKTRDPHAEVEAWRERRAERRRARAAQEAPGGSRTDQDPAPRRRWWPFR